MKNILFVFLGAVLVLTFSSPGYAGYGKKPHGTRATAVVKSASGSKVSGKISFEQLGDTVTMKGDLRHLSPGSHGFHIHEKGDCSATDASSAGDHFNPTKARHGSPDRPRKHHAGDFGNVVADPRGRGRIHVMTKDISLLSGKTSVVGRSFVVHETEDDLKSQPAGNSGARIGCGVIELK